MSLLDAGAHRDRASQGHAIAKLPKKKPPRDVKIPAKALALISLRLDSKILEAGKTAPAVGADDPLQAEWNDTFDAAGGMELDNQLDACENNCKYASSNQTAWSIGANEGMVRAMSLQNSVSALPDNVVTLGIPQ
eukprot:7538496-Pyramimonas_sp.AAC.1